MTSSNDMHQQPTEKLTIRQLIEHPKLGWRPLSDARAYAIRHGAKAIPEFAGQTIRTAIVVLAVEGQCKSLRRIEISRLKFLDDGYFDTKGYMAGIIEKLNQAPTDMKEHKAYQEETISKDDVEAMCLVLSLPSIGGISGRANSKGNQQ